MARSLSRRGIHSATKTKMPRQVAQVPGRQVASTPAPISLPDIRHLEQVRDALVLRLDAGDRKITEAKKQGQDTTRWEYHWISLLREYEATCKQIWALRD